MTKDNIPTTDSIEELAHFWDTHDLTDFDNQLEEVTEPVFEQEQTVKVCLSAEQAQAAEQLARSQGISLADLIRQWVLEKVSSP